MDKCKCNNSDVYSQQHLDKKTHKNCLSHRYRREISDVLGIQVFPVIKITDSSDAYVTRFNCGMTMSMKIDMREKLHSLWD